MANGIRAFLPGSLVDIRPVKDTTPFEGKTMEFKVIKLDRKRNNVVVSRRAVLEASQGEERAKAAADPVTKARSSRASSRTSPTTARSSTWAASTACCTSPTSPGAASVIRPKCSPWATRSPPRSSSSTRRRTAFRSASKQLGEDPWVGLSRRYPTGTRLFGKVTNLTDYGAFVEIEQGIEGLVHVSEMDWTNKNVHPSKVVQLGDEVEVMILEIDEDRRRISLGMKQCHAQSVGRVRDRTTRRATRSRARSSRSPTSACSSACPAASTAWCTCPTCRGAQPAKRPCATTRRARRSRRVVLAIDVERERISLGIKQMDGDPFTNFIAIARQGQRGQGTVKSGRRQGRGDRAGGRCRRLPARLRSIARPHRGRTHHLKEGDAVTRDDHQRRPQEPLDQPVDQGQGHGRGAGRHAEAAERERREFRHAPALARC